MPTINHQFKVFFKLYALRAAFCFSILILASCRTATTSPPSIISPPGYSAPMLGSISEKDAASPVQRTAVVPPMQMVSLTCLLGAGKSDGEHVYGCKSGNSFKLLATFPVTNQIQVPMDTNSPTMIEVRSFTNLPVPVIQTFTNDDGSTQSVTNTFADLQGSDIIFVPTNCPRIGLFKLSANPGQLVLAGWSPSTNLTVQASQDRINWFAVVQVTNSGAFQVPANAIHTQGFWRTLTSE